MAQSRLPMPSANQLRFLAAAAESNAADLAADARLLLDAGRSARAHAFAALALEELGKRTLCLEALAGKLDENGFRKAWSSHLDKLERSHMEAILSANSVQRVFACCLWSRGPVVGHPGRGHMGGGGSLILRKHPD